jgi:hypothetical protein
MRKILSGGLVMFGMASLPVVLSPRQIQRASAPDYRLDPRYAALHQFFDKGSCPASRYAGEFLDVADTYALDWRLLPSISYVESTGGKAGRNNNIFGWDSGRAQFSTPASGIYTVGYRLAHSGLYRDKSLDEVLTTYNRDAAYGRKVKSVMRRIAATQ